MALTVDLCQMEQSMNETISCRPGLQSLMREIDGLNLLSAFTL